MIDILSFALRMRTGLAQCGQVALRLQGQVTTEHKAPDSPYQTSTAVSVVDRICQEILLLAAAEITPDLAVYSEELGDCPPALLGMFRPGPHRHALILDPLDGTDEYLRGGARFAHVLGVLDQDTGFMDCGMIYFPAKARLLAGVRGAGAFEAAGPSAAWQRLATQPARHVVADIKRMTDSDRSTLARLGYQLVPSGTSSAAWELTRLIDGDLAAAVMRHFHGHDTAMASVIIEEVGGCALTTGGEPVRFEGAMPRMPLVVLSAQPDVAEELARAL